MALSYHVDYWDYLGWRDTLGGAEFSERQYDYAESRGDKNVYTPQTSSMAASIMSEASAAKFPAPLKRQEAEVATDWVDMEMSDNKTDVTITIPAGNPMKEATLWLLAFTHSISTEIKKGENAGSTIDYS